MRLIKPSFQIIKPTGYTVDDIYKSIELAGRVSHKSEDRITEDSAKTFVERMMKMKHLSTCEFGTVYLKFHVKDPSVVGEDEYHNQQAFLNKLINKYADNKYSIVRVNHYYDTAFITTNYRVLVENNWLDDLKYLCEPTVFHHKRYTVKFICDRGILAEFTRHRKFSFMAESTRYCNYSKGKFNNELTFIKPCWVDENNLPKAINHTKDDWGSLFCEFYYESTEKGKNDGLIVSPERNFIFSLQTSEQLYFSLLKNGWKPEQARNVLPLSLKTELYMCGFAEDWEKFFELRTASNAHPQSRELAIPLHEEFKNKNYVLHNS